MGRKIFQDFAHVMCQQFVDSPSNRDLVNLVILGSGRLELNILSGRATHNGGAIEPLPIAASWHAWVKEQMVKSQIPEHLLTDASLTVDYEVELTRKAGLGWLGGQFTFRCLGIVEAQDRKYTAAMNADRNWGLMCV